jgi:hypothetical protein
VFVNQGALLKSLGSGVTRFYPFLINSGSLDVQTGAFYLQGGGLFTGSLAADASTTLTFLSNPYSFEISSVVSGQGAFVVGSGTVNETGVYNVIGSTQVTGGTLNFLNSARPLDLGSLTISAGAPNFSSGSSVRLSSLILSGGVLTGSDNVTVNGPTIWTGGAMSGTGNTTTRGGLTLGAAGTSGHNELLDTRTLTNAGAAVWIGSGYLEQENGSLFLNLQGATLSIEDDLTVSGDQHNNVFRNQGVVTVAAGTGTTTFQTAFDNSGTLEIVSGTLNITGPIAQLSGPTLTGGTWDVGSNAALSMNAAITANAGEVLLEGPGAKFVAISGLAANTGSFSILGGLSFSTVGDFTNSGSLTVGAGGTLTVQGNLIETAAGSLSVQIGSVPAENQFSHIVSVAGLAQIDGTLHIALANGFGPAAGTLYTILNFHSLSGTFALVDGVIFGRFTLFDVEYTSTSVVFDALISSPDLAVTGITLPSPAAGIAGNDTTISYTVLNQGDATAAGSWVDSVYLSTGTTMDSSAVLVGRVHHAGDVAGHSSYSETLTAPLPGVLPGDYHVIVICDSRGLVPDITRVNNTLVSPGTIAVTIPTLTLGNAAGGTIANGRAAYYQITLPAGHDVELEINFGAKNAAELYARYQNVPNSASYDQYAYVLNQSAQQSLLAATQAGTYFIFLNGRPGAGSQTAFTISAIDLPFGIRGLSPASGGNAGLATVTITGTQMSPSTRVSLLGPDGTSYSAQSVVFKNTDTLFATFDLTGLSTGKYDVQITDQGRNATDAGAFTVTSGGGGNVVYNMSAPEFVRDGTMGTVTVTYENIGTSDALAPLLVLVATNAVVRLPNQTAFGGSTVQFLAINPTGAAGVLSPGTVNHITFYFQASQTAPAGSQISFQLGLTSDTTPIDWSSVKDAFRPSYVAADAWNAVWSNFLTSVGSTEGSLEDALDRDANYLSQLGEYNGDVNSLIGFELEKANDYLPVSAPVSAVDAASPVPGLPLTFSRQFLSTISGRYQMGELGRGWTNNWDISASADAQGNVTVNDAGAIRIFALGSNGAYLASAGDYGVLTKVNGAFQLREKDGTLTAFNANDTLDFLRDTDGNRITAGYTAGLLTSLTDTNGAQFRTLLAERDRT